MTPERHQQIKRLFLAAVELAPGEIQPFLDQACSGDDELRGEVESLMEHHRTETLLQAGEFSDTASRPTTVLSALRGELESAATDVADPPRPAGTMIAGRYRLATRLGRGGMGVVYLAEDVELSQTIAVKFLRPQLRERAGAIELLRREVRLARQITHPNVVRIFDLETADGESFISMEFVAGESLESLVRRVGPLPGAKVQQIARQLAGGVAAAHEAGVLHRDLKPANVMIDGAGNVRILDFGIAAPLDDEMSLRRLSGTPGFIAPELLKGQKPSQRSDLFAWGVVIYYAVTGKMPTAEDLARIRENDEQDWSPGVSDELVECVCACLESNPERRPAAARSLVAALGDPLDDAVRAGHMPSPEIVAGAASWNPSKFVVDGLLGAGLGLMVLILLLSDRTLFLSRCGLIKSPDALEDIAQQALAELGHDAPNGPVLTGIALDTDCLQYIRSHPEISAAWHKVASGEIPAVAFWYRQGDPRLPRPNFLGQSDWESVRQTAAGVAIVQLDGRGKLLSLRVGSTLPSDSPSADPISQERLFDLAGLRESEFREAAVKHWPPVFAGVVQRWEGPFAADPEQRMSVTAASLAGRVVYFDVEQPWGASSATGGAFQNRGQVQRYIAVRRSLFLVAIVVAALLAWRHVKRGHADWRGAWRVTACMLLLGGLDWLSASRHTFVATEEIAAAFQWVSAIVFCGAVAGVAYLAVEPAARRWWPWSIITTRRLLDGRLTDRGIWVDGLLGITAGLASLCLRQFCTLANQFFGAPVSGLNDFDPSQDLLDHFGLRYKVAVLISALLYAVAESLLMLTLVVGLKRVTKSTPIAAIVLVLVLTGLAIVGRGIVWPVDWLARGLLVSIAAWMLLRSGLVATIAALATFYAVNNAPLTLDWSRWHAVTGFVVAATVMLMLVICWRLARSR